MESRSRVTKGACPPLPLRRVSLRLSQGCQRTQWAGALGCLPSKCGMWGTFNDYVGSRTMLLWGMEYKLVTYHFNLQFQKLTTTMSVLRFKWFFISLSGSKMIYSFFLNWQHQLPFLTLFDFFFFWFLFCFYWALAWFILCYHPK